jgi:hypothetical protein
MNTIIRKYRNDVINSFQDERFATDRESHGG